MGTNNQKALWAFAEQVAEALSAATGQAWRLSGRQKPEFYSRTYLETVKPVRRAGLDGTPVRMEIGLRAADSYEPLEETRVEVYGLYPRASDGDFCGPHGEAPRITAAASRGADAVAGDIVRRLLPDYIEALDGVLDTIMSHEKHEQRVARMQHALLVAGNGAEVQHDGKVGTSLQGKHGTKWTARPGADCVQMLAFSGVPVELAKQLIATYNAYMEDEA